MKEEWLAHYHQSFINIPPKLVQLDSIALGLNTNLDIIIEANSTLIADLIKKYEIDESEIVKGIENWKGNIESVVDFIIGLCGCFKEGKASEWIIQNEEIYNELLDLIPEDSKLLLGGQVGIMANVLAEIGVPKILVHTHSLPNEMKELFSEKSSILIPNLMQDGELVFKHPRETKFEQENLFLHIISEFQRNECITLSADLEFVCPRFNRFIATFDPLNARMEMNTAFKSGLKEIAQIIDGMIIAGFHMIDIWSNSIEEITNRINELIRTLKEIKKINENVILQLELSSTKNKQILEILLSNSKESNIWDSLSCNDRELAEILEILGENILANNIRTKNDQGSIFEGCIRVFNYLSLQRIHIHEYGCYLILERKNFLESSLVTQALCFASILTASRAEKGELFDFSKIKLKNWKPFKNFKITEEFVELGNYLEKSGLAKQSDFLRNGIVEFQDFNLIAIPTILVTNPKFTVGLGDTISSIAFASELALKK